MASRLDLQTKLESILGNRNVYFQPPENLSLQFPCFVYNLSKIQLKKANNAPYIKSKSYLLTYIHDDPDDTLIENILDEFMFIEHRGQNKVNNRYQDVYQLYF